MKQYIKINDIAEMKKLMYLYDTFGWKANTVGLRQRMKEQGSYPIVVAHCDSYSWYLNDHGNDGKLYLTVEQALKMHNNLSYEMKIYVPYVYRDRFSRMIRGQRITMEDLNEIHKDGRLVSGYNLSVRYVEKSVSDHGRNGFTNNHTWMHFECAFESFKKVNFPCINSYTEVGKPKFVGDKRASNHLCRDYWEVTINLPGAYESHTNKALLESYVEITDLAIVDPNTFAHPEIRLDAEQRLRPSNYLYYTLFS